jgi:predicted nucleic acid-binding protein
MIAAVAIRAGATLATSNGDDFVRFRAAGLRLAEE